MVQELSQRQLRVGQEIRKVIAAALEKGEVRSADINESFVTVTQVLMSPDLKYASVYVMTLNGQNLEKVLEQLNAEKWVFKKLVAAKLKLRFTPEITFRADDSFDAFDKINKLMRDPKVLADLQKPDTDEVNSDDEL
jgi:ribosome-binding factor A